MITVAEAHARTRAVVKANPKVRECCKDDDALTTRQVALDKFHSVCRHCGARHIRWMLDPGKINLLG